MWAPSQSAARMIEGWHNNLLQRIVRVRRVEGETPEHFCRRRNRIVAFERNEARLCIRDDWALCLVRWVEHLMRHTDGPGGKLLTVQDELWIQTVRALHWTPSRDASLGSGATGTRLGRGRPIRWVGAWLDILRQSHDLENPDRDKALSRQRAGVVATILQYGKWEGTTIF